MIKDKRNIGRLEWMIWWIKVRMCESVSHFISSSRRYFKAAGDQCGQGVSWRLVCERVLYFLIALRWECVRVCPLSRGSLQADGDQCGQGVLWWLVCESVSSPRGWDVSLDGGPASPPEWFLHQPSLTVPQTVAQFLPIPLPELFPCIRLLVDGGSNWLREHKQDTGHLHHSHPPINCF